MQIHEQGEDAEEEYESALEIAQNYPNLIDLKKFTLETYKRAYSLVMTRAFGWTTPYMMLVPVADNLNHHCVESQFELFNSRLGRRMLADENAAFNNFEKQYFTERKARITFFKHFSEDEAPLEGSSPPEGQDEKEQTATGQKRQ